MKEITYAFPKLKDVDPSIYIDDYNVFLECSDSRTPLEFIKTLLPLLNRICAYDQAIVFFQDRNGMLANVYTVNADEDWLDTYLNYYMDVAAEENPQFSMPMTKEDPRVTSCDIYNWDTVPSSRFKREYIDAVNLKYSLTFAFFDMKGSTRAVISLDRRHSIPFSDREQKSISLLLPILNNFYRTFFYEEKPKGGTEHSALWDHYGLTEREKEIAELLCQGIKAARISKELCISDGTTHKHIAHIYSKLRISSQPELIARALDVRYMT